MIPGGVAPHYVYRCYDSDGVLLYVGCTSNLRKRMAAHRRGEKAASKWLAVCMDRYEVEGPFLNREAGLAAEYAVIQSERPVFNYQGTAGVGRAAWMSRVDVAQYLVEHGHIQLALDTACRCMRETRDMGAYDEHCFAHVAAQVAGIAHLLTFDEAEKRAA